MKTKVSRITIGRLYNLGNFEHIRYEISVDVDGNASATLRNVENIIAALNPKRQCDAHTHWRVERLEKKTDLTDDDNKELEQLKKRVKADEAALKRREKAREKLDKLNGTSVYKDAKLEWDEEDRY